MMGSIKVTGLNELTLGLKKKVNLDAVKKVVKQNGAELQREAQRNAPVDTGTLKRSIALEIADSGTAAIVEPTVEYAPYVEFGTRFMEAQPYLRPAFNEQKEKFKKDMKKLVE
ncbi:HK97-gp10 family putative phage morphogenesis protein [Eubacterium limosum]|uniref:HK97 gp10 family phage protein n=1 Tax=Eubacterium limosum TaxID=1736 RepID=A0ABT5UV14_EUBLI|nr:HK97-gp10 family putative phage morphogenesis protein [Eubacterium limosum]MDE1472803.1 HK97 gp10 family phage protein [Eubacterium limosum]